MTTSSSEQAERSVREIALRIEGKPEGKDRPRVNPFMVGKVYTTRKTTVAEREIRAAWEQLGKPRLPDDCALGLRVRLAVTRAQGHFKKDGSLSAEGHRFPHPRNKKPDLDNAVKLVMDALNSRAYKDDVQICEVHVERYWADWPGTTIMVYVLDGQEALHQVS